MNEKTFKVIENLESEFCSLKSDDEKREFIKEMIPTVESILSKFDSWEDVVDEVHAVNNYEDDGPYEIYEDNITEAEKELISIIDLDSLVVFDEESNKELATAFAKSLKECDCDGDCSEDGCCCCGCGKPEDEDLIINSNSSMLLRKSEDDRIIMVVDNEYVIPFSDFPEEFQNRVLEEVKKA